MFNKLKHHIKRKLDEKLYWFAMEDWGDYLSCCIIYHDHKDIEFRDASLCDTPCEKCVRCRRLFNRLVCVDTQDPTIGAFWTVWRGKTCNRAIKENIHFRHAFNTDIPCQDCSHCHKVLYGYECHDPCGFGDKSKYTVYKNMTCSKAKMRDNIQ